MIDVPRTVRALIIFHRRFLNPKILVRNASDHICLIEKKKNWGLTQSVLRQHYQVRDSSNCFKCKSIFSESIEQAKNLTRRCLTLNECVEFLMGEKTPAVFWLSWKSLPTTKRISLVSLAMTETFATDQETSQQV